MEIPSGLPAEIQIEQEEASPDAPMQEQDIKMNEEEKSHQQEEMEADMEIEID